jgi:ABC-2 type transport system ATP-binding protein
VLVSSHLMSEMALTAEQVIIIGKGRLLADVPVAEMISRASGTVVRIRTPEAARLRELVAANPDVTVTEDGPNRLEVTGLSSDEIGLLAADHQIPLFELVPVQASLEQAFMDLTRDAVEFAGTAHEIARPELEGTPR